jgi:eukaryotic-like serine/threonine-protein kinase
MRTRVQELFHELADLPAEVRARYFNERGVDDTTRRELEQLFAFDSSSTMSLESEIGRAAQHAMSQVEPNGTRCGPYRLESLLGRGGMGTVHLAERVDGEVAQRVAVKVLRPGADDPQSRQRFLAERQILATLSHPNVARLLDAGHSEDGQPYLVMEYVEGKALDVYTSGFGIRQKVKLFIKVCTAVGYLHRNLVVHRDLKPSNILVNDEGEPKLLDFGIAKMIDLTGDLTATGMRMLTPDYASPEQVAGLPVTTASDIYSLGAVLYKLLTGASPHRIEGDSARAIALAISQGSITPPSRLVPALNGDLEFVLMKALRTEPLERYATTEQFSEDLQNYLESRPIRARKGDRWYGARKFLRRYWLPVAAATLAVAGLAGGVFVANRQRAVAQLRYSEVRQLTNIFLFDFEHSIRDVPGTLEARNLVASTGQRYLKQLEADSRYDPSLEREIAEGYERLADIQEAIQSGGGKSPAATDSLLQALEIHRRLGDNRSAIPVLRRKYVELASLLAYKYQDQHNAREAARWADEAMGLSEEWVASDPQSVDALAAATAAFTRGATTQEVSGQTASALQSLEKATAFGARAVAAAPGDETVSNLVSDSERTYSEMLETVKRYSDALLHGRRALQLIEQVWARHPDDPRLRLKFLSANSGVGMAEHKLGKSDPAHLELALPYLQRAFTLAEQNMGEDPRNVRNKSIFVAHTSRLCSLLITMKRFDTAAPLFKRAEGVTRELIVLDPNSRRSWYLLGKIQLDLGWMYLDNKEPSKGKQAFLAADEGFARGLEMDPTDTVMLECRTGQYEGLALAARSSGDLGEARHWMQQCFAIMKGMISRDPSVRSYISGYDDKLKLAREIGLSTADLEQ